MTQSAENSNRFIHRLRFIQHHKYLLVASFSLKTVPAASESLGEVAICNSKFTMKTSAGVLAQLVERLNGIEEVTGSNPVGSNSYFAHSAAALQNDSRT